MAHVDESHFHWKLSEVDQCPFSFVPFVRSLAALSVLLTELVCVCVCVQRHDPISILAVGPGSNCAEIKRMHLP